MEQQVQKIDLSRYWRIFRRRMVWGVLTALVLTVLTVVAVLQMRDRYVSSCIVEIRSEEAEWLLSPTERLRQDRKKISSLVEQFKVEMSRNEYVRPAAGEAGHLEELGEDRSDPAAEEALLQRIKGRLKFAAAGEDLVRISYRADTAGKAERFLVALHRDYQMDVKTDRQKFYKNKFDSAKDAVAKLEDKLAVKKDKYKDFLVNNRASLPGLETMKERRLAMLEEELLEVERDLKAAREKRDFFDRQMRDLDEFVTSRTARMREHDPVRMKLQQQLGGMRVQLIAARERFTDEHPTVKHLTEQVRSLEDEISKMQGAGEEEKMEPNPDFQDAREKHFEAVVDIETYSSQKGDIQATIEKLKTDVERMPQARAELERYKNDIADIEKQLTRERLELQKAENQYNSHKQGEVEYFAAKSKPTTPKLPENRRKLQALIAGIVLSIAAGIGAIAGMEYIDQSFTDVNDARDALMIPALGEIPRIVTRGDKIRKWAFRFLMVLVLAGIAAGAVYAYREFEPVRDFLGDLWFDLSRILQQQLL